MEPLMSYEGFVMLQDDRKSRDLLNDYFREQGYTVASSEPNNKANSQATQQNSAQDLHEDKE